MAIFIFKLNLILQVDKLWKRPDNATDEKEEDAVGRLRYWFLF